VLRLAALFAVVLALLAAAAGTRVDQFEAIEPSRFYLAPEKAGSVGPPSVDSQSLRGLMRLSEIAAGASAHASPVERVRHVCRSLRAMMPQSPRFGREPPVPQVALDAGASLGRWERGRELDRLSLASLAVRTLEFAGFPSRLFVCDDAGLAGRRSVVLVEVWLPTQGSWMVLDPAMGLTFHRPGGFYSLLELRSHLAMGLRVADTPLVQPCMPSPLELRSLEYAGRLRNVWVWLGTSAELSSPGPGRWGLLVDDNTRLWPWRPALLAGRLSQWLEARSPGLRTTPLLRLHATALAAYLLLLIAGALLRRADRPRVSGARSQGLLATFEEDARWLESSARNTEGAILAALLREPLPADGPSRILARRKLAGHVRTAGLQAGRRLGPALRLWWRELVIGLLLILESAAYVALSGNLVDCGGFACQACVLRSWLSRPGLLAWLGSQQYYPPLYPLWLSLGAPEPSDASPWRMVLWSALLLVAGFLGLAAALRRWGVPGAAVTTAVLLMAGSPLVAYHSKIPAYECGLVCTLGLLLWQLAASGGLPASRRGQLGLGAILGAGLLVKWTFAVYAAVPAACAVVWTVRLSGLRETLRRGWPIAVVTSALGAPWYLLCLDWKLLWVTTGNDANFPGLTGLASWWASFDNYLFTLGPAALGSLLLPLTLLGASLALWRRPREGACLLATALLSVALLSCFRHSEIRYLLPVVPVLAALAGLGLGSVGRPWPWLFACVAAVCAVSQAASCTWSQSAGAGPSPASAPIDNRVLTLPWPPGPGLARAAIELSDAHWTRIGRPAPAFALAVHPLCTNLALHARVFQYLLLANQLRPVEDLKIAGYHGGEYAAFLDDLEQERFDFLVIPLRLFDSDPDLVRHWSDQAWAFIPPVDGRPRLQAAAPEDRLAIGEIRRHYGVVDRLETAEGAAWLLVARRLWERVRQEKPGLKPLGEVPEGPPGVPAPGCRQAGGGGLLHRL
jgi:hypothetical protein